MNHEQWIRAMGGLKLISAAASAALWIVTPTSMAGEAARLAPADAAVVITWEKVNTGENHLVQLVEAALSSPLVKRAGDEGLAAVREIIPLIDAVSRQRGAFWFYEAEAGGPAPLGAAMVIEADENGSELDARFARFVRTIPDVSSVDVETIEGMKVSRASGAGPSAVCWGVQGKHFVAGVGNESMRRIAALLKGGKTVADRAEWVLSRKKTGGGSGKWHLTMFGDMQSILRMVTEGIGDDAGVDLKRLWKALGMEAFKTMYVSFEEAAGVAKMSAFVHMDGSAEGLVRLWKQRPLTDEDVAVVPADAYWAQVWTFDANATWKEAMSVAEKTSTDARPAIEGVIAAASQFLGFNPVDQLMPAMGEGWAFYDAPDHAGLLVTGFVLVCEARDAEAIEAAAARVVELIAPFAAKEGVMLTQREATIEGQKVNYVVIGGYPVPVAPSWGTVNGRVVFGLFPQTVATAMRQVDAKTRGPSLLDNAEFKKTRPLLPAALTGITYADSRYFHRTYYGLMQLAHTAVASMSAGSKPTIDVASMPVFRKDLEGVRNSLGGYSVEAEGLLYQGYGTTPAGMVMSGDSTVATTALMVSILLPSLSRARELSKRAVCAANLVGISQGMQLFANENLDALPPDFETLVTRGLCTRDRFVCPSDGSVPMEGGTPARLRESGNAPAEKDKGGPGMVHCSYKYIGGQTMKCDMRNVVAYEPLSNHNGEGGSVLFLDGHVEFVRPPRYQEVIRETYRRLGREGEMPEEIGG